MATEPFPDLQDPSPDDLRDTSYDSFTSEMNHRRVHRKSSGLPGDPRGDTAVSALATLHDRDDRYSSASQDSKSHGNSGSRSNHERSGSSGSGSGSGGRRSKRKRVKGAFKRWKAFTWRHTWVNPLIICAVIVLAYLVNPSPSNPLHAALFLSYAKKVPVDHYSSLTHHKVIILPGQQTVIRYGKGSKDFAFVAFYTVFLSFTREFVMQRVLRPLAIRGGIRSRSKQARFMEQAYTAMYFALFGPFGLYVMSQTDLWFFNTAAMYKNSPYILHEGVFKTYYLLQASYWAQQMIVLLLMLEKPRKDFKELVAHHIITLSLIALSYMFHFTRIGLAVYITHDVSDFFLATSKVLNYLDSALVIPYFIIFIFAWTYLRHYHNLRILASMLPLASPFPDHIQAQVTSTWLAILRPIDPLIAKLTTLSPQLGGLLHRFLHGPWTPAQFASVGPFDVNWVTQQYKCWISQWITFALLAALQAVNVFWLFLILRILYRMVRSAGVPEDDRSEYSDEEEDGERRKELAEAVAQEKKQRSNDKRH